MNKKQWEKDAKKVAKYYNSKIVENGCSTSSLAYRDKKYVNVFFDALFTNIEIKKNPSFLDIGCGLGLFIDYMQEHKIEAVDYLGIDLMQQFIDYSKTTYSNYNFIMGNFISDDFSLDKKYDYVFALGVLVSRVSEYEAYLLEFIKKMISYSKEYVLFNLITDIDKDSHNYSNRDEIGGITDISKRKLKKILDSIDDISYKIIERKIFDDATDAFIQIKIDKKVPKVVS